MGEIIHTRKEREATAVAEVNITPQEGSKIKAVSQGRFSRSLTWFDLWKSLHSLLIRVTCDPPACLHQGFGKDER